MTLFTKKKLKNGNLKSISEMNYILKYERNRK